MPDREALTGQSARESSTEERLAALREQHGKLLDLARDRFDVGQTALAARHDQDAMKIANTLVEVHRLVGNACSDFRLLEWKRP